MKIIIRLVFLSLFLVPMMIWGVKISVWEQDFINGDAGAGAPPEFPFQRVLDKIADGNFSFGSMTPQRPKEAGIEIKSVPQKSAGADAATGERWMGDVIQRPRPVRDDIVLFVKDVMHISEIMGKGADLPAEEYRDFYAQIRSQLVMDHHCKQVLVALGQACQTYQGKAKPAAQKDWYTVTAYYRMSAGYEIGTIPAEANRKVDGTVTLSLTDLNDQKDQPLFGKDAVKRFMGQIDDICAFMRADIGYCLIERIDIQELSSKESPRGKSKIKGASRAKAFVSIRIYAQDATETGEDLYNYTESLREKFGS